MLLFRQTSPNFLNPASKWLSVNPTKPEDPNYSILNTLDNKCKDDKGKFEFMLVWPKRKGNNYNVWKQSTNPVTEKTKVQGYEAVDVKFKSSKWGGLESGYLHSKTPPALLDGSVNHGKVHVCTFWFAGALLLPPPTTAFFFLTHTVTGSYFYAVGSIRKWEGGFPGPSGAETQVELYVKCTSGAWS